MKILHIGKKGNISKYIPNLAKEKNYNFLEISNANDISAIKSSLDEIEFYNSWCYISNFRGFS